MQTLAEFQPTSDSSEGAGSSAAGERPEDREGETEVAEEIGELATEKAAEVIPETVDVASLPAIREEENIDSDEVLEPDEIEDPETGEVTYFRQAAAAEGGGGAPPEEPPRTAESMSDDDEPRPEPDIENDETDEEIPAAILSVAEGTGITADTLRTIHNVLQNADWADTLDFLRAAQKDEQLRNHLIRRHGVELEAPSTDHVFPDMPLKDILEIPPSKYAIKEDDTEEERARKKTAEREERKEREQIWAAERARRMQERAHELEAMLKKYNEFIPAEMPLLPGTEVPHDLFMPDDPEGAYGVWRRLKIQEYEKRIRVRDGEDTAEVEAVRAEIKRIGGPLPGLRRVSKWILAFKILQTEKKESKAAGSDLNYGALGFGAKRLDHIAQGLKKYDESAKDARRALGRKNRSTYTKDGQGTARRHLAEKIITIRQEGLAHEKGHLDPIIPRRKDAHARPDEHGSAEMVT